MEDLGQGSESIRILGIKWLPQGAAARSVTVEGSSLNSEDESTQMEKKEDAEESADSNAGLEAEEGNVTIHTSNRPNF